MKKIYPNSDFTLEIPVNLAGLELKTGATISFSVFTMNRDESYNFTISENPVPSYITLSGNILTNMSSGIIQAMMTINIPDGNMDDSYYNYSRIITTDCFWVSDQAQITINQINNKVLDLSNNLSNNYYTKSAIDSMLEEIDVSVNMDADEIVYIPGEGIATSADTVDEALDELYLNFANYLTVSDASTTYATQTQITSLSGDLETLGRDLQNNYYSSSFIDTNFVSVEDVSGYAFKTWCVSTFYPKEDIDSSIAHNYYDMQAINVILGSYLTKSDASVNYITKTDASVYATQTQITALSGDLETLGRNLQNNYYSSSVIDTNYYIKDHIDTSIAALESSITSLDSSVVSNYYNKAAIDTSISAVESSITSLDSSVVTNYYTKGTIDTMLQNIPGGGSGSIDTSNLVDVSTFENTNYAHAVALSRHDTSIGLLDSSVSALDSSVSAHDASISAAFSTLGDVQTALNSIINS